MLFLLESNVHRNELVQMKASSKYSISAEVHLYSKKLFILLFSLSRLFFFFFFLTVGDI